MILSVWGWAVLGSTGKRNDILAPVQRVMGEHARCTWAA